MAWKRKTHVNNILWKFSYIKLVVLNSHIRIIAMYVCVKFIQDIINIITMSHFIGPLIITFATTYIHLYNTAD